MKRQWDLLAFVVLAPAGLGCLPDLSGYTLVGPPELFHGCFQSSAGPRGVLAFDEGGAISGNGRGLFVGELQQWTFIEATTFPPLNRPRREHKILSVTYYDAPSATNRTAEVLATITSSGEMLFRSLRDSGLDIGLTLQPCGETAGLYDSQTRAVLRWRAHLNDVPDEGFAFEPPMFAAPSELLPVAGDWNGDGRDTHGIYDPRAQTFFLACADEPETVCEIVTIADLPGGRVPDGPLLPVAGDWDGDGTDGVGVFASASGTFVLLRNFDRTDEWARFVFGEGALAGVQWPVAGDWDGSGADSVGLYDRAAGRFLLTNSNRSGPPDVACNAAMSEDVLPVAGDWGRLNHDGVGAYTAADQRFRLFDIQSLTCVPFAEFQMGPGPGPGFPILPIAGNWYER